MGQGVRRGTETDETGGPPMTQRENEGRLPATNVGRRGRGRPRTQRLGSRFLDRLTEFVSHNFMVH